VLDAMPPYNKRRQIARQRIGAAGLLLGALLLGFALLGKGAHAHRHLQALRGLLARKAARRKTRRGAWTGPDAEAQESGEIRRLITIGKPIYCAGAHGNEVALTFDDGPGQYTYLAVPKLRRAGVKATFFIVGRNIRLLPRALPQERALGSVGDHTFTHPLLTAMAPSEAEAEIVRTKHAVERASRGPVFLFRPPYGARNAEIDSIARRNGLLEIMWTVDSADSLGASYAGIERNAIAGLRPGAIVLMHENRGQTIRAMPAIFAAVRRRGLRTVSVARLLTDDPPSEAQLRGGGAGCGLHTSEPAAG
jgi:peptidoglycan/xylan/chitin deacetylase (PgdA/CDA1 family)